MKLIENLKFWFSSEGGDKYRKIINNYFETQVLPFTKKTELLRETGFDIVKLIGFPFNETCTFMTKELSSYILGDNIKGFIRFELSITIALEFRDININLMLGYLAHKQLEVREPFKKYEIINIPKKYLCDNIKLTKVMIAENLWLNGKMQGFLGDINTNIIEVVLINDVEANIIKNSVEEFINMTQNGEINILDLNR